jgi:hypothetical protein
MIMPVRTLALATAVAFSITSAFAQSSSPGVGKTTQAPMNGKTTTDGTTGPTMMNGSTTTTGTNRLGAPSVGPAEKTGNATPSGGNGKK